jgi:putative ABC transport system permease protein
VQADTGRGVTWLVMGLAGFVLLIACANLANLQFARNAARGREHALRAALGASRAQLMRHVLTESLLLALAGGALGLLVALWSNDLISRYFFWGDRTIHIALDPRVVAFTFAASVLTGLAFGILPAWLAGRANVSEALKQGARGSIGARSQNRLRHTLIVGEVALALMLLAGAGFFFHGLQRFTHRDPGWRMDGLLTAYINLRGERFSEPDARNTFFTQLHDRVAALPGVERAAIGSSLPTWGYSNTNTFVAEGQPEPAPGRAHVAASAFVTPGFFDTLGIRLLQGRDFAPTDRPDTPKVVIINQAMARKLWPGESPLGKRIGGATPFLSEPRVIVGVVSDVRPVAMFGVPEGRFQMYRPLAQATWWDSGTIALRTRAAPESLAGELRRVVAEIDPDQAVYQIVSLRPFVARSLGSLAVAAYALVAFAALGVLLAAIGIYGVISNSVVQRTNEIGVRMALGAQWRDILRLILGGGLRLIVIGTAIGLAGAYGIARLLGALSPEFAASHPLIPIGVTTLLVAVALFACWVPARRAARLNPMSALHAE